MKTDKRHNNMLKTVVEKFVRVDANSTSCIFVYQPKAPEALKQYINKKNDK